MLVRCTWDVSGYVDGRSVNGAVFSDEDKVKVDQLDNNLKFIAPKIYSRRRPELMLINVSYDSKTSPMLAKNSVDGRFCGLKPVLFGYNSLYAGYCLKKRTPVDSLYWHLKKYMSAMGMKLDRVDLCTIVYDFPVFGVHCKGYAGYYLWKIHMGDVILLEGLNSNLVLGQEILEDICDVLEYCGNLENHGIPVCWLTCSPVRKLGGIGCSYIGVGEAIIENYKDICAEKLSEYKVLYLVENKDSNSWYKR